MSMLSLPTTWRHSNDGKNNDVTAPHLFILTAHLHFLKPFHLIVRLCNASPPVGHSLKTYFLCPDGRVPADEGRLIQSNYLYPDTKMV